MITSFFRMINNWFCLFLF